MRGRVYLVGSGEDGLLKEVAGRACRELGRTAIRVGVSYAPVTGDARGLRFMSERMQRLFPGATLETVDTDPTVVDRVDLVFISGGDPTLGAKTLEKSGVAAKLRAAVARGTAAMGVSAGAIVLGAWWVDWPTGEAAEATSADLVAKSSLVHCTNLVPGYVFDTHNEEDDWDELRVAAALVHARGEDAKFIGIPTRAALVFEADGSMEAIGPTPFRLQPDAGMDVP